MHVSTPFVSPFIIFAMCNEYNIVVDGLLYYGPSAVGIREDPIEGVPGLKTGIRNYLIVAMGLLGEKHVRSSSSLLCFVCPLVVMISNEMLAGHYVGVCGL